MLLAHHLRRASVPKPNLPVHVALLDDHAVVRLGMLHNISDDTRLMLVGDFGNSADLLSALRKGERVDVLLLDYALAATDSDGAQLILQLRKQYPAMRILVASAYDSPATVALVLRAGAHGFWGKGEAIAELPLAILKVASGKRYLSDARTADIPHVPLSAADAGTAEPEGVATPYNALGMLSKREQEVLRCILDGMVVTEIASKYSRTVKTISNQKQAAFRKLGIRSIAELVQFRDSLRGP